MSHKRKYKYSQQADIILQHMPFFDYEDFEKWYDENIMHVVGNSHIMAYLIDKNNRGTKNDKHS